MKKVEQTTPRKGSFYCSLFGHQFEVSKKVTYYVKEYKCCNCKIEMTTNSNGSLTELTPKFREINSVLERIHINKITRYAQANSNRPLLKMIS